MSLKNVARKRPNKQSPAEPEQRTADKVSSLAELRRYILMSTCLLIGCSSVILLLLSIIVAFTPYNLASLPFFGGFLLTLKMMFKLAGQIIAKSGDQEKRRSDQQ